MIQESPYEYIEHKLGVQGRYIYSDKDSDSKSLCLISYSGLNKRISRGATIQLRLGGGSSSPMLVSLIRFLIHGRML